jgi:hypothetical protein
MVTRGQFHICDRRWAALIRHRRHAQTHRTAVQNSAGTQHDHSKGRDWTALWRYEIGQFIRNSSGNRGQEFVIGGYTVGGATFDALIFGYYEGGELIYAARTSNGFTPRLRQDLMKRFQPLEAAACPFANLPETKSGRWGAGLTAKRTICGIGGSWV